MVDWTQTAAERTLFLIVLNRFFIEIPQLSFLFYLMVLRWKLTVVIEQAVNFGSEGRENVGVEQSIQPSKQQCANDDGDQNLHSRIYISFGLFALDGGLNTDSSRANLVLDFVK